ncbi:MAG TPA: RidA family protein [Leptolyngbyaceae cyanobacterium M65_K2018_010]|nr:RidA family protein [Leptolyngbyaceae cyanobacterium M65_K2018_010]
MVQRTFSGTPWEAAVGYCRAIRLGPQIFVSGTAPSDGQGGTFAPGDAYAQTKRCFEIIEQALTDLGADLSDIVRTRLYVTDMSQWEAIAQAHQELFADHPPASTLVAVAGLINPDMVVEIEAEAYCEPATAAPLSPLTARTVLGRPIQPTPYPPTAGQDLDEGCLD